MKGMNLQLEDGVYEAIPEPKRPWVAALVEAAVKDRRKDIDVEFAFVLQDPGHPGGKFLTGPGKNKGDALKRLGYGSEWWEKVSRSGTAEQAKEDGWWVVPSLRPLEVPTGEQAEGYEFKSPKGLKVTMDFEDKIKDETVYQEKSKDEDPLDV